jgi:SAM-dependent methyltransferase
MARNDATRRFSNRVENYVRYRPGYPEAVRVLLEQRCALTPSSFVADVGSGTGLLAELFLRRGCLVYGVEPNPEMREAGERALVGYTRFVSVDGRAEATTLAAASVDIVAAGQAFHWFDRPARSAEFSRILKPDGWVVLVWNKRRKAGTRFLEAYERMLQRWSVDYAEVDHERVTDEVVASFFAPSVCTRASFPTEQRLSFEAARGRLESSSYAPASDQPNHMPMLAELHAIFDAHNSAGVVVFEYDTVVYFGRLEAAT